MTTSSIVSLHPAKGLAILLGAFLVASCSTPSPPPECEIEELLLSLGDLPTGMELTSTTRPAVDSTVNSETRTFSIPDLQLGQSVYWYPEVRLASRKYHEESEAADGPSAHSQDWADIDLTFVALQADEQRLGCGPLLSGGACIYVARYKSVVTLMHISFPNQEPQLQLIGDLAEAIDSKLVPCSMGE